MIYQHNATMLSWVLHKDFKLPSLSTCLSLLSITVLHGHVHRVRAVRGSLALLVCLLLEGSAADPVLDRRGHHPRHAGESCVLLGVPEHPLQRRLRSVDLIHLLVCGIIFVSFYFIQFVVIIILFVCLHSSRCCYFCWAAFCTQKIFSTNPGPHCQSRIWHSPVSLLS